MKLSGKTWIMIILKVTKNQGFTLSLESTFLEKPQGGRVNLIPSLFRVKLHLTSTTNISIKLKLGAATAINEDILYDALTNKLFFS